MLHHQLLVFFLWHLKFSPCDEQNHCLWLEKEATKRGRGPLWQDLRFEGLGFFGGAFHFRGVRFFRGCGFSSDQNPGNLLYRGDDTTQLIIYYCKKPL